MNLSGEGEPSEVSYFGKWMKNNCEGAWVSAVCCLDVDVAG